jgi:hypothetical protein
MKISDLVAGCGAEVWARAERRVRVGGLDVAVRLITEGEAAAIREGLGAPVPPSGRPREAWTVEERALHHAAVIADQARLGLLELGAAMGLTADLAWEEGVGGVAGGEGAVRRGKTGALTLRGAMEKGVADRWVAAVLPGLESLPTSVLAGARKVYAAMEEEAGRDAAAMVGAVVEAVKSGK